jgi:hypothetical protein
MKTTKFLFIALIATLVITACQKDDIALFSDDQVEMRNGEEPQMVPFKGDFAISPIGTEMIACFDPEANYTIPTFSNHAVNGNATHLGLIDPMQSQFNVVECALNIQEQLATFTDEIILKNKKGDGLFFLGNSTASLAGPGTGYYVVVEGYGKFENATGWINTIGNISGPDGPVFAVDGMVTQPNH